jgi:hypothetical protein
MIRIIDGKRYNTQTAELVAEVPCGYYSTDFNYHDTGIYISQKGTWFLAGSGNALSMWAKRAPGGGYGPGRGIRPLDDDDAREHLERAGATDAIERFFDVEDA